MEESCFVYQLFTSESQNTLAWKGPMRIIDPAACFSQVHLRLSQRTESVIWTLKPSEPRFAFPGWTLWLHSYRVVLSRVQQLVKYRHKEHSHVLLDQCHTKRDSCGALLGVSVWLISWGGRLTACPPAHGMLSHMPHAWIFCVYCVQ